MGSGPFPSAVRSCGGSFLWKARRPILRGCHAPLGCAEGAAHAVFTLVRPREPSELKAVLEQRQSGLGPMRAGGRGGGAHHPLTAQRRAVCALCARGADCSGPLQAAHGRGGR